MWEKKKEEKKEKKKKKKRGSLKTGPTDIDVIYIYNNKIHNERIIIRTLKERKF